MMIAGRPCLTPTVVSAPTTSMMTAKRSAWIVAAAAAALVAAARPARAQSAEADVLFREGKKLLKAGKIAEACEKLDASERLESSVGTLLNLADCRERNRQLATAWATFRKAAVAARKTRDGKREKEAHRREKLLGPRLSYLGVNVPEASRVDGLAIARNGAELDRALWNQSVPVDAGDYELVASADGFLPWTEHVRIAREAQRAEVDVPALSPRPAPPPRPRPTADDAPSPRTTAAASRDADTDADDTAAPRDAPPPSPWTGTRKLAIGLAAAGVAGVALGATFGLLGRDREQKSDALCPMDACDDARALSLNADARRDGLVANISFAAGGGLVATAAVLWFVGGPRAPQVTAVITSNRVGVALAGGF
jgi:serine/threonine-protein kinase